MNRCQAKTLIRRLSRAACRGRQISTFHQRSGVISAKRHPPYCGKPSATQFHRPPRGGLVGPLTIAPHSLGARIHNHTEAIGTDAVDDAGIPDVRQTTRSQTHRPACGFLGVAPSTSTARKYPWTEAKALVGVARVLPEYSQLGAFRNTSPEARHTRPCAHCAAAKTPAKDHPRILMIATGETTLPVHREQSTTATS